VASLGPDPADLPVRTLTEPVTSLAAGQDLADLTDLQSFSLYRSEYTRSNDTTESLLQRLALPTRRPQPSCAATKPCARTCWAAPAAWCPQRPRPTSS
jgi:hypothetical protein